MKHAQHSDVQGEVLVRDVFSKQGTSGMGWDERGNMLEKSRWGDRRGLGFCMWAVFVSDPAGR